VKLNKKCIDEYLKIFLMDIKIEVEKFFKDPENFEEQYSS